MEHQGRAVLGIEQDLGQGPVDDIDERVGRAVARAVVGRRIDFQVGQADPPAADPDRIPRRQPGGQPHLRPDPAPRVARQVDGEQPAGIEVQINMSLGHRRIVEHHVAPARPANQRIRPSDINGALGRPLHAQREPPGRPQRRGRGSGGTEGREVGRHDVRGGTGQLPWCGNANDGNTEPRGTDAERMVEGYSIRTQNFRGMQQKQGTAGATLLPSCGFPPGMAGDRVHDPQKSRERDSNARPSAPFTIVR